MKFCLLALSLLVGASCQRADNAFGKDCGEDDDCDRGYVCRVDACVPDDLVVAEGEGEEGEGEEGEGEEGEGEPDGEACAEPIVLNLVNNSFQGQFDVGARDDYASRCGGTDGVARDRFFRFRPTSGGSFDITVIATGTPSATNDVYFSLATAGGGCNPATATQCVRDFRGGNQESFDNIPTSDQILIVEGTAGTRFTIDIRPSGCPINTVPLGPDLCIRGTPGPAMDTGRSAHTATLLENGKVLLYGGVADVSTGAALALPEIYDPGNNRFTSLNAGAYLARQSHTATLLPGNRVLLVGGVDEVSNPVRAATLLNADDGTFEDFDLDFFIAGHTATLLADGRVLLAGGFSSSALTPDAPFEPTASTFFIGADHVVTSGPPLPAARARHQAVRRGDEVVVGVGDVDFGAASDFVVLDAGLTAWRSITTPLHNSGALGVFGGEVFAIGGFSQGTDEPSDFAHRLAAGDTVDAIQLERFLFGGTTFESHGVLGVVGAQSTSERTRVEAFDGGGVVGGATIAPGVHISATATPLQNGKVLVAGGFGLDSVSSNDTVLVEITDRP